jgi:Mg2+/Co2+ transporter CorB
VVDEYGDVIGLLTLEAILEEVVGEFTTKVAPLSKDLMVAEEGYLLVNGAISLRELQKALPFQLPETQAKTLNGLITEILGSIPPAQSSLKIENRPVEILKVQNNRIKMVKFHFEEA